MSDNSTQALAEKYISNYYTEDIIWLDSPIPLGHKFVVRSKYCDFYLTSKFVKAYLKPEE